MTIANTSSRTTPSEGNGSNTSFPFTFKVFSSSDVVVVHTSSTGAETVLVETTNYTISVNADQDASPGGTVTYPASGTPLPAGEFITVYRSRDYAQTLDLVSGGAFNAENIEDALDSIVMQLQQVLEAQGRTIKLQISDVSGASVELPTPVASRPIGWNADGDALANLTTFDTVAVSSFMETVLDDADGAAALTTLINSATAATARATLAAMQDVITTRGDLVVGDDTGAAKRLARGIEGQRLTVDASGDVVWADEPMLPRASVLAPHVNLKIQNGTTAVDQVTITASELLLTDGTNYMRLTNVSVIDADVTVDASTTAQSGYAKGFTRSATQWANIFVVSNGTNTYVLYDASNTESTGPDLTDAAWSGYYWALVGAIYSDGSTQFINILQTNHRVAGDETQILSAGTSTAWTNTFTVAVSTVVPPIAAAIAGFIGIYDASNSAVGRIAPSAGFIGSQQWSLNVGNGVSIGSPFTLQMFTPQDFYWQVNAGGDTLNIYATGWEF